MVKFLEYKGDKLPVRVSYYALKMLKEKEGLSMSSMADDDYTAYEALLFYALKKGHEVEGKEFKLTMEDMEAIMDEVFFDFVKLIPLFFPQIDLPKGGDQKKVIEKK